VDWSRPARWTDFVIRLGKLILIGEIVELRGDLEAGQVTEKILADANAEAPTNCVTPPASRGQIDDNFVLRHKKNLTLQDSTHRLLRLDGATARMQ